MSSSSSSSGVSTITVTFDVIRDQDLAQVDVQNRVSTALGRLPTEVRQLGVTVSKQTTGFVLAAGVYAEKGEYDSLFLSNYIDVYVKDAIKRVPGVSDVTIFGERRYSMRLWLDPQRLAARQITAADVTNALQQQNVQVAAGALGQAPSARGPAVSDHRPGGRAPGRSERVRRHHRQERRRRIARPREGRRPRRARRGVILEHAAIQCAGRGRLRRHPAAVGQRARRLARRAGRAAAALEELPARPQVPDRARHDRGRARLDPRSIEDAGGSDRARRPGHLHLPAVVAQHAHPGHHHPGVAGRRLRLHQAAGLLDQYADPVRHHPRHRHRGRRCDCGDREHRAAHSGVPRPGAEGGRGRDG